jgi:hypothetical protein
MTHQIRRVVTGQHEKGHAVVISDPSAPFVHAKQARTGLILGKHLARSQDAG